MKGLEPSHLAAPDPKSVFMFFSYFIKSFHFLSKYRNIGIYKGYYFFDNLQSFA